MSPSLFYLSPAGNDAWSGALSTPTRSRMDGPWATLAGARDALRRLRAAGLAGAVTVRVQAGHYPLAETVVFGPQDGDTTYEAESGAAPVIDGGQRIEGWKVLQEKGRTVWVATLPEVPRGGWTFRSLFVNGVRRPRARWPKFSVSPAGAREVDRLEAIRQTDQAPLQPGDHCFKPSPAPYLTSPHLAEAEFVMLHYWADSRLPQPQFDPATGWVSCARRSTFRLFESWGPALARYYVDNLRDALTEPGEWFLDARRGELRYLPLPGETPDFTPVVAPRLHTFLRVEGVAFNETKDPIDPHAPRPVVRIFFTGLTFTHADWYQPPARFMRHDGVHEGHIPAAGSPQAASNIPGTILFRYARECGLRRCTLRHAGMYAVEFGPGCIGGSVTQSRLHDLGAGGIKVDGGDEDEHPVQRTGAIEISDNEIHGLGRVFHQGVGILVTNAYAVRLIHNHIHDSAYTGISVGWSWGYRPTISRDHLIEGNHIHDIGHGLLSDMGGIYLLGVQPGTVVRRNRIHHVKAHAYGGWGLYLDEGAAHIVVEDNLVHDTQGACLNLHYGRENIIRRNVLARGGEALVCLGKIEPHVAATLLHNVLIGPTKRLYIGGYEGDLTQPGRGLSCDLNTLCFSGQPIAPSGNPDYRAPHAPTRLSWRAWQKTGRDHNSQIVTTAPLHTEGARAWTWRRTTRAQTPRPTWADCGPRVQCGANAGENRGRKRKSSRRSQDEG